MSKENIIPQEFTTLPTEKVSKKEDDLRRKETEAEQRMERCGSDFFVKCSTGFLLGSIFSIFFFRRRAWPVAFGGGIGFGTAMKNCENEFKYHH